MAHDDDREYLRFYEFQKQIAAHRKAAEDCRRRARYDFEALVDAREHDAEAERLTEEYKAWSAARQAAEAAKARPGRPRRNPADIIDIRRMLEKRMEADPGVLVARGVMQGTPHVDVFDYTHLLTEDERAQDLQLIVHAGDPLDLKSDGFIRAELLDAQGNSVDSSWTYPSSTERYSGDSPVERALAARARFWNKHMTERIEKKRERVASTKIQPGDRVAFRGERRDMRGVVVEKHEDHADVNVGGEEWEVPYTALTVIARKV